MHIDYVMGCDYNFGMKKIFGLALAGFICINLFSQTIVNSTEEKVFDYLLLAGETERPYINYRTLSDSVWETNNTDLIKDYTLNKKIDFGTSSLIIFAPAWFSSFNSTLPNGYNDRGLWQGKGYNTYITSGFNFKSHGFEVTFRPQINFSQNMDFTFKEVNNSSKSPYSYPYSADIDLPQRFGSDPFFSFDFGDSEIRYTYKTFTVGFGTQNPWLGPAYVNPMLGSTNAEGYPKFDIGFRKTKLIIPFTDIDLGYFDLRLFCGMLTESDYFDNNETNNKTMLNMLSIGYEPSFIPGLSVGANRLYLVKWKPESLIYLLDVMSPKKFNSTGTDNDEDQKVSLFLDYKFPLVGFEFYAEYGFDDFTSDKSSNPFHTGIYTVGIKQNIPLPFNLKSQLIAEFNQFEMSQDFQLQWPYSGYYTHHAQNHGYTNKGQIIGAATGSLGNNQYFEYKVFFPKGYAAFIFQRYCPDNNYVYSMAVNQSANYGNSELNKNWYANYETHFLYGVTFGYNLSNVVFIEGEMGYNKVHNYMYEYESTYNNFYGNVSFKMKI